MRRLDPLTEYLRKSGKQKLVLSFDRPLPSSARKHPAFWSNSSQNAYSRAWREAKYSISRRGLAPERVAFVRDDAADDGSLTDYLQTPTDITPDSGRAPVSKDVTAVLLGCVSRKASSPLPAKDLYISGLFRRRRRYAEASGRQWMVLSSKYGLIDPEDVIDPYDFRVSDMDRSKRETWGRKIAEKLGDRFGGLQGKTFEVHAGADYVNALRPHLMREGAELVTPLSGLRIGEQLQWYDRVVQMIPSDVAIRGRKPLKDPATISWPSDDARGLARSITQAFNRGHLDLRQRHNAPIVGWKGMPEVKAVERMRAAGSSDADIRLFLAFISAMDRARDADRLWADGATLFVEHRWVYDPKEVVSRSLRDLSDTLRSYRVSQRHTVDAAAWRMIAETLNDPVMAPDVHEAIMDGKGDTLTLLGAFSRTTQKGSPLFPMIRGPKVGPMFVRLLAYPGNADITSLDKLPVAVDVQVRKVTEYLGVCDTFEMKLDKVRKRIQRTWSADVETHGAEGPDIINGTPAALDPAIRFFGKWGCTFCKRKGRRMPINNDICKECRFDDLEKKV